jgi:hypothetical protein
MRGEREGEVREMPDLTNDRGELKEVKEMKASAGGAGGVGSVGPVGPTSPVSPISKEIADAPARTKSKTPPPVGPGLAFPRFFTEEGNDPFDDLQWELRAAVIGNERGEIVFEQRGRHDCRVGPGPEIFCDRRRFAGIPR